MHWSLRSANRLVELQARLGQIMRGKNKRFDTEPTGYEKTNLSDLQGTWQCLRRKVAESPGFDGWERALFHIDEAMRWGSVRNLRHMHRSLILVRNILQQATW